MRRLETWLSAIYRWLLQRRDKTLLRGSTRQEIRFKYSVEKWDGADGHFTSVHRRTCSPGECCVHLQLCTQLLSDYSVHSTALMVAIEQFAAPRRLTVCVDVQHSGKVKLVWIMYLQRDVQISLLEIWKKKLRWKHNCVFCDVTNFCHHVCTRKWSLFDTTL